jgi:sugar phosphate isomerase/epimerase
MKTAVGILAGEDSPGVGCDFVQVAMFRDSYEIRGAQTALFSTIDSLKKSGVRYVLHPVGYFLSETRLSERAEILKVLEAIAKQSDMGMILHDETTAWGTRLEGIFAEAFQEAMERLLTICPVSIENAVHSPDAMWFWRRFARSVTLDVGHLESAGLDSEAFVAALDLSTLEKIDYVHVHRYDGAANYDHRGLKAGCRELSALKKLLAARPDAGVILELLNKDEIEDNLDMLFQLKKEPK